MPFGSSSTAIQVTAGGMMAVSDQIAASCWLSRAVVPRAPVPVIRLPIIRYPRMKKMKQAKKT